MRTATAPGTPASSTTPKPWAATCARGVSAFQQVGTLQPSAVTCQHFSISAFWFRLLPLPRSWIRGSRWIKFSANRIDEVFCEATRLACASRTNPPDLSGGPLGCFSVFCPPGLAPWAAKAVAGVLLAMLGVRADPPKVHRREIHRRSQFAPDLATRIKLALLHFRQYRAVIPDSFANSRCESPSPSLWSSTILANAPALSSVQPASSGSRPKTSFVARPDASGLLRAGRWPARPRGKGRYGQGHAGSPGHGHDLRHAARRRPVFELAGRGTQAGQRGVVCPYPPQYVCHLLLRSLGSRERKPQLRQRWA